MSVKPDLIASWRVLVELACFLPLLAAAQSYLSDGSLFLALFFFFCGYMAGYLLARLRMKVYMERLAGAFLAAVASVAVFGISIEAAAWAILIAFMIARGMRLRSENWDRVFPISGQFIGICSYMLFPGIAHFNPALDKVFGLMYAAGFFVVVVFFFRLNRLQLANANLHNAAGGRVPANVVRTNRFTVAALLLLLILAANLDAIHRWLNGLWARFKEWVNEYFSRLTPPEPETQRSEPMPSIFDLMGGEQKEPSEFWRKLQEIVIDAFAAAFILALVLGIVYLFVTRVMPFMRNWLSKLNERREEQVEYTDETEKLAAPEWGRKLRNALGRIAVRRAPEPADHRERVRYQYKRMLQAAAKDGYQHHRSNTPMESERALEAMSWRKQPVELLTRLYNRVRYGEIDVSEQDIRELRENMKNG